jgi:small subunit ribosomal protein S8
MMTDPVADLFTRVRNAVRVERPLVDVPASNVKIDIAKALQDEGYILGYQVGVMAKREDGSEGFVESADPAAPKRVLRIFLKYGPQGEHVIQHLKRISSPGCRIYKSYRDLKPVLDGLGIALVSTSKGVMSDRQARKQKLGGEVLCTVW